MGKHLLWNASAELALALAPITAVPARTHRAAAVRWVDPVSNGLLRHGIQTFGKATVFGTDVITLLDHLHGLGFGDRI